MLGLSSIRTIPVENVKFEKKIYPRTNVNWQTVLNYKQAMENGSTFPPIDVANLDGETILIDGKHRLEATMQIKQKYISANFIKVGSLDEAYVEALKRNLTHGRQLSFYEKILALKRLKDAKWELQEISAILQIPEVELVRYSEQKITLTTSGEEIVLKAPLEHLAGKSPNLTMEDMRVFDTDSQLRVIQELITLLRNHWLNRKDKNIMNALKTLKGLL